MAMPLELRREVLRYVFEGTTLVWTGSTWQFNTNAQSLRLVCRQFAGEVPNAISSQLTVHTPCEGCTKDTKDYSRKCPVQYIPDNWKAQTQSLFTSWYAIQHRPNKPACDSCYEHLSSTVSTFKNLREVVVQTNHVNLHTDFENFSSEQQLCKIAKESVPANIRTTLKLTKRCALQLLVAVQMYSFGKHPQDYGPRPILVRQSSFCVRTVLSENAVRHCRL